jgi:hypothetical protein
MIAPLLVLVILARAFAGHGHEIPCEAATCTASQEAAHAHELPAIPVDQGPHYDKRARVEVQP